jgi:hypothetical protein
VGDNNTTDATPLKIYTCKIPPSQATSSYNTSSGLKGDHSSSMFHPQMKVSMKKDEGCTSWSASPSWKGWQGLVTGSRELWCDLPPVRMWSIYYGLDQRPEVKIKPPRYPKHDWWVSIKETANFLKKKKKKLARE